MKKLSAIIGVLVVMLLSSVSVSAATYYISNNGNDTNDGLSESTAWRTIEKVNQRTFSPGDKILFESGGVWSGSLWVRGSGTKGNVIEIGQYGTGSKPVINGDGENAAVFLYNQQYVRVRDLEITNKGEQAWRYGVYVCGYEAGQLNGIEIRNLTVHDVNGLYTKTISGTDNHWNGGIVVSARSNSVATRFVGLTITGCEVYDVARSGIVTLSNMFTDFDKQIIGMSQQMNITNNRVHDIKGDGIVVCGDYKGRVSGNTVYNTNLMSYLGEASSANVGIFAIHSTGTVISENESYLSRTEVDGFGYDIDGNCDDVVIEYNYSHDNDGGFILLVNYENKGSVVRYNISKNDKHQSIAVASPSSNTKFLQMTAKVYNNTIYSVGASTEGHIMLNIVSIPASLEVYNNIFYLNAGLVYTSGNSADERVTISNNLYYGCSNTDELGKYDLAPVYADPCFEDPESVGTGYASVNGFMLKSNSPCIGKGIVVSDNGGYDFWGNLVSETSAPSIGAYEGE